jgi:DNA-binding NarL/FixJ family response regulator
MVPIRVLLADDHRILREGLRSLLAQEPGMECVGEAIDGNAAIQLARQLQPDVLVTDIAMPGLNGIEAIRRLRTEMPQLRVLVLSAHDEERLVLAAMEAGACGYLLKDSAGTELVAAIEQVALGRIHLASPLVGMFVKQYRARQEGGRSGEALKPASSPLTPRERELVQLFSEGHSTSDIAERLHLSVKTVATHRENILHKLRIGGVAEMTRYALREGITSL